MNTKHTLRNYLFDTRLVLYEFIDDVKNKVIAGIATDDEIVEMSKAEAELNIIKDVINICNQRGKY